jgi:hypothetical protein
MAELNIGQYSNRIIINPDQIKAVTEVDVSGYRTDLCNLGNEVDETGRSFASLLKESAVKGVLDIQEFGLRISHFRTMLCEADQLMLEIAGNEINPQFHNEGK